MFQFNPYASYEAARIERELRQQRAALLAVVQRSRPPVARGPWRKPAFVLGLRIVGFGERLQRWSGRAAAPEPPPVADLVHTLRRRPARCIPHHHRDSGEKEAARAH